MGGIPVITERSSGDTKPVTAPKKGPQMNPARSTGRCIGQSIPPTAGIWPVKNGRMRARASIIPDRIVFFSSLSFIFKIKRHRGPFEPRYLRNTLLWMLFQIGTSVHGGAFAFRHRYYSVPVSFCQAESLRKKPFYLFLRYLYRTFYQCPGGHVTASRNAGVAFPGGD